MSCAEIVEQKDLAHGEVFLVIIEFLQIGMLRISTDRNHGENATAFFCNTPHSQASLYNYNMETLGRS